MSHHRISQILTDCVNLGIVEININHQNSQNFELEAAVECRFNMTTLRIVGNVTEQNAYSELGFTAGHYPVSVVCNNDIIGFSRGRTLSAMMGHMPARLYSELVATQPMWICINVVNDLKFNQKVNVA